jgi:hypothetical protein
MRNFKDKQHLHKEKLVQLTITKEDGSKSMYLIHKGSVSGNSAILKGGEVICWNKTDSITISR